ncbi:tRNA pseudouridine(65) synthase TruC [Dechloromonas denitrificans]|uniref:tRNA pseudouridine(65) synthase TruC n=1 Tax=Dechloromonas denitrificans TaxID=281362 RepID=UPI001CF89B99|nr:tRNA pseudouridine(65) synthase TruC [Dechloromonas denitrificans]UCV12837.1 tRNA pseudouridine(65) synthase TruC [Dechloromonas denitrificans]
MAEQLPILFRDQHLVVIDKPPGLLVHRSEIDRHETRFAIQILRDQIGQRVWPAHRLDRGTSGVLLFALDIETAGKLGRQFEAGIVDKRYLAVVRGIPPESGEIDHPLTRQRDSYEFKGENSSDEAQTALTHYRRLASVELPFAVDRYPSSRYALVELLPVTGRRHQLRRHLKHIAHPIIGDATHGKGRHNRFFAEHFGANRLLLACTELSFDHPISGQRVNVKAPVSGEFATTLAQLGWLPELNNR